MRTSLKTKGKQTQFTEKSRLIERETDRQTEKETQRERDLLESWYFEPSEPQRITSGQKQISICLVTLYTSHQTTNFLKMTQSVLTQIDI